MNGAAAVAVRVDQTRSVADFLRQRNLSGSHLRLVLAADDPSPPYDAIFEGYCNAYGTHVVAYLKRDANAHLATRAVARAIVYASETYRAAAGSKPPPYDTTFWRLIFCFFYGEAPKSDEDPRWDRLLQQVRGYGALMVEENLRKYGQY
jgi:hypothetical protein